MSLALAASALALTASITISTVTSAIASPVAAATHATIPTTFAAASIATTPALSARPTSWCPTGSSSAAIATATQPSTTHSATAALFASAYTPFNPATHIPAKAQLLPLFIRRYLVIRRKLQRPLGEF